MRHMRHVASVTLPLFHLFPAFYFILCECSFFSVFFFVGLREVFVPNFALDLIENKPSDCRFLFSYSLDVDTSHIRRVKAKAEEKTTYIFNSI